MRRGEKYHTIQQIICWLLLIQMINVSIDPRDLIQIDQGMYSHTEDLSINETESIYELIAEKLFDTEIPESEEEDVEKTFGGIDLFFNTTLISNPVIQTYIISQYGDCHESLTIIYPASDSPPPDLLNTTF